MNTTQGWVVLGPDMGDPLQHARFVNVKHMTPLPQYGSYQYDDSPKGVMGSGDRPNAYRWILEKGGLKEFPATQLIEMEWDKLPVVKQLRPDVANVQRKKCTQCTRDFTTEDLYQSHMRVMHKEIAQPEAIGRAIREGVQATTVVTQQGPGMQASDIGVAVAAAVQAMMPTLLAEIRSVATEDYAALRRAPGRPRKAPVS